MNQLSIIIPALNEFHYIGDLLASIAAQTDYRGRLQIIVVDGRSKDRTADRVKEFINQIPDLTVLTRPPDIGAQRNLGAAHAKYDYLLFLDADTILPPHFLAKLTSKITDTKPFIGGVWHIGPHMTLLDDAFLAIVYFLILLSRLAGTPATNGDCILVSKALHEQLHGFKEGAILGEDADYCIRAFKSGARYRFFLSPHIITSDRRVRAVGRIKLFTLWAKAFTQVRRTGQPIYPDSGFDYPFGDYDKPKPRK